MGRADVAAINGLVPDRYRPSLGCARLVGDVRAAWLSGLLGIAGMLSLPPTGARLSPLPLPMGLPNTEGINREDSAPAVPKTLKQSNLTGKMSREMR